MGDDNNNNITSSVSLPLVTKIKLLLLRIATKVYTRRDGTFNKRLFNLAHPTTSAPTTHRINATTLISTSDFTLDSSRNLWFRLFVPTIIHQQQQNQNQKLPLILYFHGGGFTTYGPNTKYYHHLCTHLAAGVPAVIASVNYRLAPDHKYPAQYEDGFDILKFIDAQHSLIIPPNTHVDLTKCFIGGDSAGANIAHHVTVRALQDSQHFNNIRIIGILGLQPFFGGEERTKSELLFKETPTLSLKQTDVYWREFLPEGADRNHPAAHVFADHHLIKNFDYFPTTLVIVGGNDPLQD